MAVPSARSLAVPSVFTDFTGPSVPSVPSCCRLTDLQFRMHIAATSAEFMWLTSPLSQHRLPTSGPLIDSNVVSPSATVRDLGLGVFIDQDLTMKTHVQQTASRCFATFRQLRSIRRCIPTSVFHCLVSALVLSRLDYCNSLLIDLPSLTPSVSSQSKMPQQGSFQPETL